MTSTSLAPPGAAHPGPQYKGKHTHRFWPQLPEEIIRLITSHYLWDLAATSYCPSTWETRKQWYSRMAYSCIRDSIDLEKGLMSVCPEWRRAIEKHAFWTQALHIIDPNDFLIFNMVIRPNPQLNNSSNAPQHPIYLTAYQHFRNIMKCSCFICRINHPQTNIGLANAKRGIITTLLGYITICKDHEKNRSAHCGLCLRDSTPLMKHDSTPRDFERGSSLGIHENEDEDTWPGVESTCRKCRTEWLWRRVSHSPRDRDAVGGPSFHCHDWEAKHHIENFIDLAEGTIADVLTVAREKLWLRVYTKYEDLGQHMLAAQKGSRSHDVHEEEEEDSEEDREAMLTRGSGQVREMALNHWARQRIIDGHWLSPADIWYNHVVPGRPTVVPAAHPCPWAREGEAVDPTTGEEPCHPLPATLAGEVPPSFQLCEQAYLAHMKQMREVLGPPLRNVVRKLVLQCSVPTAKAFDDPAHLARKMSLEDVVAVLREEEGVWYDGVDWVERKRNEAEALRQRRADEADALMMEAAESRPKEDDNDSTTSSSSDSSRGSGKSSIHGSSNATSPVLSTSTLQTTPSPPPLSDEGPDPITKKDEDVALAQRHLGLSPPPRPRFIPVDPVRSPPRLLGTIPYVPVTISHLPNYSLEAIRSAWREACVPLYHCGCSVCERAKVVDMNARAAYAALNAPQAIPAQHPVQPPLRTTLYPPAAPRGGEVTDVGEIQLDEVNEVDLDGDGEEEVDYDASDIEYDDDEEDDDDLAYDVGDYRFTVSPEPEREPERPRKRSSDELDAEDRAVVVIDDDASDTSCRKPDRREHGATPTKRARIGDDRPLILSSGVVEEATVTGPAKTVGGLQAPFQLSPTRRGKRNSEELELDDAGNERPLSSNKRVRVDRGPLLAIDSPPASDGDTGDDPYPSAVDDTKQLEDKPYRPPRSVRKAELDTLIALEVADE